MIDPAKLFSPSMRTRLLQVLPWIVGAVVIGFLAIQFVDPPPPKRLVIATGSTEGAYYHFAQEYARAMAQHGITLEVRSTAGSVENLEYLRHSEEASDVSLAIVQGGADLPGDGENLVTLAALYQEPIWIFYRAPTKLTRLEQLRGANVAIGPEGSGVRVLAEKLMAINGLMTPKGEYPPVRLSPLGGSDAAGALRAGQINAAIFVVSSRVPMIRELLATPGIKLMNLERADAYLPHYPFLSRVTLHKGVLDLKHDIPSESHQLLAANASLVARKDLHGAIIPPLLQAARVAHDSGGPIQLPGTYPTPAHGSLPLHRDADRFFRSGPSFLFRILPFPLAAWLDRMKLLLLPLATLLFPLFRTVPPLFRWRIRRKIYRWYRVLHEIDDALRADDGLTDWNEAIQRLDHLESRLQEVSIPLSYSQELYNLRLHISFLLERLRHRNADTRDTSEEQAPVRKFEAR